MVGSKVFFLLLFFFFCAVVVFFSYGFLELVCLNFGAVVWPGVRFRLSIV